MESCWPRFEHSFCAYSPTELKCKNPTRRQLELALRRAKAVLSAKYAARGQDTGAVLSKLKLYTIYSASAVPSLDSLALAIRRSCQQQRPAVLSAQEVDDAVHALDLCCHCALEDRADEVHWATVCGGVVRSPYHKHCHYCFHPCHCHHCRH